MKKMNNKGVTLVELIVSFALVSVAVIYFYQTVYTVKRLYTTARKETNRYVDINYTYRMLDAKIENHVQNNPNPSEYPNICNGMTDNKISDYIGVNDDVLDKYKVTFCKVHGGNNSILQLRFTDPTDKDKKIYNYVKYLPAILADPAPTINASISGDYNESTGWYYNRKPILTVTVSENNGAIIKRFERCENGNCEERTLTNNKYVEELQDTASGALTFKVTNYKDKQATKDVTYKVDTVKPRFLYKAYYISFDENSNNGIGSYNNMLSINDNWPAQVLLNYIAYYYLDNNIPTESNHSQISEQLLPSYINNNNYVSLRNEELKYCGNLSNYYNSDGTKKEADGAMYTKWCPLKIRTYIDIPENTSEVNIGMSNEERAKYYWEDNYRQVFRVVWYDDLSGFGSRRITNLDGTALASTPSWVSSTKKWAVDSFGGNSSSTQTINILEYCDKAGNCFCDQNNRCYDKNNNTNYLEIRDNPGWDINVIN